MENEEEKELSHVQAEKTAKEKCAEWIQMAEDTGCYFLPAQEDDEFLEDEKVVETFVDCTKELDVEKEKMHLTLKLMRKKTKVKENA